LRSRLFLGLLSKCAAASTTICVPVVVILLGLAVGTQIEHSTFVHVLVVVIEAIGIGLVVGLALAGGGAALLRGGGPLDRGTSNVVSAPALAGAGFAVAQAIGGSSFIACFAGGLLLGALLPRHKHERLRGAEGVGWALSLMTWLGHCHINTERAACGSERPYWFNLARSRRTSPDARRQRHWSGSRDSRWLPIGVAVGGNGHG
jgi:hypothetical protein